jgi:hypothetical protein
MVLGNNMAKARTIRANKENDLFELVGHKFITRISEAVLPTAEGDTAIGLLHELNSVVNLFQPTPGNVSIIVQQSLFDDTSAVRLFQKVLHDDSLSKILHDGMAIAQAGHQSKNEKMFYKGASIVLGVGLFWGVRFEYSLKESASTVSPDFLYNIIEKIGLLEKTASDKQALGPLFTAAYVLRFQRLHEPSDFYYLWAAMESRVQSKFGETWAALPASLTRNLFDVIEYGVEISDSTPQATRLNFLPSFEKLMPSIRKHFPFHDNLTPSYFGKLGIVRDKFKESGNTKMVDELSRLRLSTLSERSDLTPSCLERKLLSSWGMLTDWGTSVSRVARIGLTLFFILAVCGFFWPNQSGVTEGTSKDTPSIQSCSAKVRITNMMGKLVSYATLLGTEKFDNVMLDFIFGLSFFLYYSVVLGTAITFMIRHS